ncbi:AFG2-interacting ribosome maturation factor-like [Saccostrea echinata]|uniref:AFG2-interacting ribosome maturation factor-like n=1 Tax=Saccostrea echinata TaxID=191078 RepID=UPI002A82D879|nr:AFG2-interacting ribosome maturation factor-like [Saccostrea echinata]
MEYIFPETGKDPRFVHLLQQLHKAFSVVKSGLSIWEEAIAKSQPHLKSVQNLSEQHHCCVQAQGLGEIVQRFPDVREKLLYKINKEIDNNMANLYKAVDVCKEVCDKVSKQCTRCQVVYNKTNEDLNMLTRRSPTCPSAVEMLEWLQDSEYLMMNQYLIRKHLLDKFSLSDRDQESVLYKQWSTEDTTLLQTIKGHLQYLEFFLEMKI